MRGPYAIFNIEELEQILVWSQYNTDPVAVEIKEKCETALRSDPRFRQPMKPLPPKEVSDALHRMQS